MPMWDRKCETCGTVVLDKYEQSTTPDYPCVCGGNMRRVLLPGKSNAVVGDEIDVEIRNGLCHPDGTPRRFRSRTELRAAEKAAGYENYVVHRGTKEGDRSPHTSRWI